MLAFRKHIDTCSPPMAAIGVWDDTDIVHDFGEEPDGTTSSLTEMPVSGDAFYVAE